VPRPLVPLLVVLLLLGAAARAAPAAAAPGQVMTFEAPAELLDESRRDAALDEIAAFGVTRIRQQVYWRDFAPSPTEPMRPSFDDTNADAYPGGTWDPLDHLVDAARSRNLEVELTLTGPVPQWATQTGTDQLTRPDPAIFANWVTAVVRRYGDRVDLWSIWNEPNQPQFLLPQYDDRRRPVSPRIYRGLYVAAERALHAVPGNARDRVLIGETSPIGDEAIVAPLAFLRGVLCLDDDYRKVGRCANLRIAGYAHHAYPTRRGPLAKPSSPDSVTIGALERLVRALDRAARAGVVRPRLPIFLTEFGVESRPDVVSGVTLARQAQELAIAERMAFANPRVRAFSQYLLRDDPPVEGVPEAQRFPGFETGLRFSDGREKPSYAGFLLPLAVKQFGASDVLWGRVRPAPAVTAVTLERNRGRGWRAFRTQTTNPSGVYGLRVPHRARQRYRVRWTAPDGTVHTGPPIRPY
jgi:hypothetical protein